MSAEPTAQPAEVTISIVSFNTRELLAACLRSVFGSVGITFEVHVVDNGSSDGSAELVERDFPQVRLTRSAQNRGFAAANNCVIREASGEFVLLLNPDTVVSPTTIANMVEFMRSREEVGICGPKILFGDGRFQSCGYQFPTLMSELRLSSKLDKLLRRLIGDAPTLRQATSPFEADWVDGACFLIRRKTIDEIGLLDEQFFLYNEELDWCRRARTAGWRVYALPTVEMIHHQGKSSSQISDTSLSLLVETRLRYYRKTYGTAMAALTSLVYVAGFLKQLTSDPGAKIKLRATVRWWRTLGAV
jgi:N-acetylglucosaminyl-diphospho-decaprenol L-rhamnosyltransferase